MANEKSEGRNKAYFNEAFSTEIEDEKVSTYYLFS